MFICTGGTADPRQHHHGPVLALAEVTLLSVQDQPGPTCSEPQHQLFHGSISPRVRTGAVGGAGRDEVTGGSAVSPLPLRCPTPTAWCWLLSVTVPTSQEPFPGPGDVPGSWHWCSLHSPSGHRLMPAAGTLVCQPTGIEGCCGSTVPPPRDFASFLCMHSIHKLAGVFF